MNKLARLAILFFAGNLGALHGQTGPCGAPVGPLWPDLTVSRPALKREWRVVEEWIAPEACAWVEGCVRGTGARRLLRFNTTTPNVGATALWMGNPAECGHLFHLSECHGHYHFEAFADYRLWTRSGYRLWRRSRDASRPASDPVNATILETLAEQGELIEGRKQGFCLRDNLPVAGFGTARTFTNCMENQGLSAGWADVYGANLDCQYVDVTGRAPGRYVLEVEVNPDWLLPESRYDNNAVRVRVRLRAGE